MSDHGTQSYRVFEGRQPVTKETVLFVGEQ